ncbi:arylsulfatase [Rhodopirellula maiorica SM1]|uniref:Arylsulfatase n=2 Tax=Novipirellula TaxID=2795426 RepID=M5SA66_9BACT|nr:arylsulfatase [Rhodopirellula maiorica SM1]
MSRVCPWKTDFMKNTLFIAVVMLWFATAGLSYAADRPNVVLLLADDISQDDIGCYGHPTIQTPHIDALAASGMRFDNAYLTTSSCSPSRCSIITGRYPHNTGAPELHTELPSGSVLFPQLLKDAGYYTVLSGKHHMGKNANVAFSKISKGKGPGKEGDWVQILEKRPQDKPFFCWYASTDAHRDWAFSDEAPKYEPDDVVVPPYMVDAPKTREDLASYYHEVSRFDHYVGQVVAELKRQQVFDDTLVIVMADNGRPFPRCKTRLYDSGIKTPFVVHYPSEVTKGVTDSLISSIDIAATVLDLAGIEKDQRIQGVSFAPILKDTSARVRDVVFAEHNWHVYRNHERLVRFGDWLYIRNNFPDQPNLCVEAYLGGAGEDLWAAKAANELTEPQQNVFLNPCPAEELYHTGKDHDQLNNLATNPETQQVLEKARGLLTQWTEQTGDTIPANPTPDRDAPPGSPAKDRKAFKYGELPGAASGATDINHPGPIRLP